MENKLIVTAAPHITSADSTQRIMGRVCVALVPTLIASVFIFGINSLILTAVTVAACVFFEWAYCKLMGREVPIDDLSAVVTGMLLAFNLPATMPWWMAVVGAFIIGICENVIKSTEFSVFSDAGTFALLILILVLKPTGLFGEKVTDKV